MREWTRWSCAIWRTCAVFALPFVVGTGQALAQISPSVQLVERARPTHEGPFSANSELILSRNPKFPGQLQMWNWRTQEFVGPPMLFNSYQKRLFDQGEGDKWTPLGGGEPMVQSPRFSQDGRFYGVCRLRPDSAAAPHERKDELPKTQAQVWDVRTGEIAAVLLRSDPKELCQAIDFSPDGKTLVMAVNSFSNPAKDGPPRPPAVVFYDTSTWQEKYRYTFGQDVHVIAPMQNIRFSPSGNEVVLSVSDHNLGPDIPPEGKERGDFFKKLQVGNGGFRDNRTAAVVIDTRTAKVLARKVLHWSPDSFGSYVSFDSTGQRVVSHGTSGHLPTHIDVVVSCLQYTPSLVPDGFAPEDLCKRYREMVTWHWRTSQVDRLVEGDIAVRDQEPSEMVTYVKGMTKFTPDGRYLIRQVSKIKKGDGFYTGPYRDYHLYTSESLELLDANTYQVLLRHALRPRRDQLYFLQMSMDGRYLKFKVRESQEVGRQPETPYLYEIVSQ